MKTVIATDGQQVSGHFGRCPSFTVITIDNNTLVSRETIANPGHSPGYLPRFFHEMGISCIIAGGMGMNAQSLFSQFGIEQILGISGSIDDVIASYCNGTLTGGESLCKPGGGKGYGVEKTVCDHSGPHHHGGE